MNKFYLIILALTMFGINNSLYSQTDPSEDLIQFSGMVLDADSLSPVPFASILAKDSYRGTITDYFGYFSFVAKRSDTIVFSHIGKQNVEFVIPDTLTTSRYSLIQIMKLDTISLDETVVFPWPTKDEFREAFLNAKTPDADYLRAQRNLAFSQIHPRTNSLKMRAEPNYKASMQQMQSKLYYAGRYPVNNLLNPVAWSRFIKSMKKKKK